MKKITLRRVLFVFLSVLSIIACTKEITDDLISSFELTENHQTEGFLNVPQTTEINITGSDRIDLNGFQWKYNVTEGSGSYTLNEEVIPEGEFIPLTSQQINIRYIGTTVGQHKVTVTVKNQRNRERTIELLYTMSDTAFVFEAVSGSSGVGVDESVDINMNITEVSPATYQTKYVFTNTDADGAGSGIIRVGTETLSPDTFTSVATGDFTWSFEATVLGTVEILLTTKSSFDIEAEQTVVIDITELSTYTFTVATSVSEALTDDEVVLNFDITDNGVASTYTMSYTTSVAGSLLYEGSTYAAGDPIPVVSGASTGNYTGTSAGVHTLDFTVLNANQVPIEQTGSVMITYSDPVAEAPIITLNGDNPMTLTVGDVYTEVATAADAQDGDLTASIVFGGTFDGTTTTAGSYTRTYDVTDSEANTAVQKIRTIIIEAEADTEVPVITLNGGGAAITLNVGDVYTEAATAIDNVDGDLTAAIVFGGDFDGTTNTAGVFTRTYNVSDAAGNAAVEQTRTITIESTSTDTTPPVIALNGGGDSITLTVGDVYTEAATATDDTDGDITAAIVFGGNFDGTTVTPGVFARTYNVSDAAGNPAVEQIRTITIEPTSTDTTPPVIALNGGGDAITLNVGDTYTEAATATDDTDGDITADIVFGGDFDGTTNTAGVFTRTYNVSDAAGNAAVEQTRTITVESTSTDTTPPVIALNGGGDAITLNVGDTYTEAATATDDTDGDITTDIVFGGDFDGTTNTAGVFTRTYNVSDAAGNPAVEQTRTITIESTSTDTTPPVIALNDGGDSITLTVGDVYTEVATATDDTDGDITANLVFGGNFDGTTTTEGAFSRTYNVSDAAGNPAEQKIRVITVVANTTDTTAPVIELNSDASIVLQLNDSYTETATATDDVDGDITADIVFGGDFVGTTTAGTFTRTYNVSDVAGNVAEEKVRTIRVNAPPQAFINPYQASGEAPFELSLGASLSTDSDGVVQTVSWNFGDGSAINTGAFPNSVTHIYTTPGTYTFTLTVTDNDGAIDTNQGNVTVTSSDTEAPVIVLNGLDSEVINIGDVYSDPATANDNVDGDITADIVYGGTFTNSNTAGTFGRTYNVMDAAGNPAEEKSRSIRVNDPPMVSFTAFPLSGTAPLTVTLNNSASTDSDGNIVTSVWSWNDGGTGTAGGFPLNTNHIYTDPGTYTLELELFDNDGGSTLESVQIVVEEPLPDPTFDLSTGLLTAPPGANVDVIINSGPNNINYSGSYVARADSTSGTILMDVTYNTGSPNVLQFFTIPASGEVYFTGNHGANGPGGSNCELTINGFVLSFGMTSGQVIPR